MRSDLALIETDGRLQVFAADDKTGDGIIATYAFLTELHRQPNLRLYRTWRPTVDDLDGWQAGFRVRGDA